MKCPTDDTVLSISERSGIEIDWCPSCRGVWLDRGELDKLIERVAPEPPAIRTPDSIAPAPGRDRYGDGDRYRDGDRDRDRDEHRGRDRGRSPDLDRYQDDQRDGRRPAKKRTSRLSEIFDF